MSVMWLNVAKSGICPGTLHSARDDFFRLGAKWFTIHTLTQLVGNKGPQWQYASIILDVGIGQVDIVATRGSGTQSDIAIDDVIVSTGYCLSHDLTPQPSLMPETNLPLTPSTPQPRETDPPVPQTYVPSTTTQGTSYNHI